MRAKRVSIVMLASEKLALERLAEAEGGLSQAALVRWLVRREAKAKGLWPVTDGHKHREVEHHGR